MAILVRTLAISLIIALALIAPVTAVMMLTDYPVVRIYLEQEGSPYAMNSSISITCFGYVCSGKDCRESTRERVNTTGDTVLSDICPSYGCTFYRYGEIGELYGRTYYSRCDLRVSSPDRNYTLTGYADRPFTNCSIISSSMRNVLTPEYFACMDRADDNRVQCVQDNTSSDQAWVQSCWDAYTGNIGSCRSNDTYSNPAISEWRGEGFPPRPATEVCDMHFTLPSDTPAQSSNVTPGSPTIPEAGEIPVSAGLNGKNTAGSRGPAGSLWCSLLQLLGGRWG